MNITLWPRNKDGFLDTQTQKLKRKNDLAIGIWNIRTMLQAGKMNEIAAELNKYKFDIVAL